MYVVQVQVCKFWMSRRAWSRLKSSTVDAPDKAKRRIRIPDWYHKKDNNSRKHHRSQQQHYKREVPNRSLFLLFGTDPTSLFGPSCIRPRYLAPMLFGTLLLPFLLFDTLLSALRCFCPIWPSSYSICFSPQCYWYILYFLSYLALFIYHSFHSPQSYFFIL